MRRSSRKLTRPERSVDANERVRGLAADLADTAEAELVANRSRNPGAGSTSVLVRDEGVDRGTVATMDFTGAGVTASVAAGVATVNVPGGGGIDVRDEGVSKGTATALDFVGSPVTLTFAAGVGTVTVTAGAASPPSRLVSADLTLAALQSLVISTDYEIASGINFEVAATAILEVI